MVNSQVYQSSIIGEQIKNLREKYFSSQEDFVQHVNEKYDLGLKTPTYRQWEKVGERTPYSFLTLLAGEFDVTMDYFFIPEANPDDYRLSRMGSIEELKGRIKECEAETHYWKQKVKQIQTILSGGKAKG